MLASPGSWNWRIVMTVSRGSVTEQGAVGVECRLAAQVSVENAGLLADFPGAYQVDEACHRLALVDGIDDHSLEAAGEPDRIHSGLHGDAVVIAGPSFQDRDLLVAKGGAQPDEPGGLMSDLGDLRPGLIDPGRCVDAQHAARPVLAGEAGDHPGVGGPGDTADDDRVEE